VRRYVCVRKKERERERERERETRNSNEQHTDDTRGTSLSMKLT